MKSKNFLSENVIFNPLKNINKKEYTPNKIYQELFVSEYNHINNSYAEGEVILEFKEEYFLSDLIVFIISTGNISSFRNLIKDYPYILDIKLGGEEPVVFLTINYKKLDFFKFLKELGVNFNNTDFDDMNVYENAIYNPDFWDDVYGELSMDDLYEKITQTKSDVYKNGCFEFLFEKRDMSLYVLKKFKIKYPDVFKKIIEKFSELHNIKFATGETLLVIRNYDTLLNELKLIPDNCNKKEEKKVLKF